MERFRITGEGIFIFQLKSGKIKCIGGTQLLRVLLNMCIAIIGDAKINT